MPSHTPLERALRGTRRAPARGALGARGLAPLGGFSSHKSGHNVAGKAAKIAKKFTARTGQAPTGGQRQAFRAIAMKQESNFTDNLSIAGNMPNPKKSRIVVNMAQPDSPMGAESYMTKHVGKAPRLPGKPLAGTLGASDSKRASGIAVSGGY